MFQSSQFNLKKVNRQNFYFYGFLCILFIKCCFCKSYESAYPSNFGNEKAISIDTEELSRRRNVAESYLKKTGNREKDWIETYHESIHVTFPFQNEDRPSLKNLHDSVHQRGSLFNEKKFVDNPKDETVSFKKNSGQTLQETHKNSMVNQDSLNSDNDETPDSHVSVEISESSKIYKHPEKSPTKSRSKSNKPKKIPESCEMSKDRKSGSNVKYCSFVKNDDLRINELKNLSVNANEIIQIMLKNSEFTSEKYFINGETLTLTEFYKLKENLASLSFLQRSKNNVYSINRMNIIDSIGKITPLLKQDKFYEGKHKQFCKFSFSDNDTATEPFCFKDDDLKKVKTRLEKRVGYRIQSNEITFQKRFKDSSLFDATNNEKYMLLNSVERSDGKDFSRDSEMLRRKTVTNNFVVTTLNNNQENWIETYHLNVLKDKPDRKSTYNLLKTKEQNYEFSKVYSQERLYIIRWIKKLQNKLKDSHSGDYTLSISVSADLDKLLEDLSREFDIVLFDELVNNMISNTTSHNNYANTMYFNYEYISNAIFPSLNSTKIFIFITFLFCIVLLLYNFSKTRPNDNLTLHRMLFAFVIHIKWILLVCLLIFSFSWHGYKMYQQKIAEKHSVMSRVVPSYCDSILAQESGVAAHFKEFFRSLWYDEDCKKYYEAVMVDPSSEINPFSISTDLIADTVFQMLRPFARNMNSFFKALTYDLSFFQQFIIIGVAFFALIVIFYFSLSFFAFRRNYRVNFPFHLGSVEPTEFCKGSRVEEVEEKSSVTDFSTNWDASLVTYKNETENKNCTEDIVSRENTFKIELNHFKLAQSKHCALKAPRTRHNSI